MALLLAFALALARLGGALVLLVLAALFLLLSAAGRTAKSSSSGDSPASPRPVPSPRVRLRSVRRLDPSLGPARWRVIQLADPRATAPYWQEQGWVERNSSLSGYYSAARRRFEGRVELPGGNYFIRHPPQELRRHSHWPCFQYQRDGWYRLHFATRPRDPSSGILAIERMLHEALRNGRAA